MVRADIRTIFRAGQSQLKKVHCSTSTEAPQAARRRSLLKQVRSRATNRAESHKSITADDYLPYSQVNKVQLEGYQPKIFAREFLLFRKVLWSVFGIVLIYKLGAVYVSERDKNFEFKKMMKQKDMDRELASKRDRELYDPIFPTSK